MKITTKLLQQIHLAKIHNLKENIVKKNLSIKGCTTITEAEAVRDFLWEIIRHILGRELKSEESIEITAKTVVISPQLIEMCHLSLSYIENKSIGNLLECSERLKEAKDQHQKKDKEEKLKENDNLQIEKIIQDQINNIEQAVKKEKSKSTDFKDIQYRGSILWTPILTSDKDVFISADEFNIRLKKENIIDMIEDKIWDREIDNQVATKTYQTVLKVLINKLNEQNIEQEHIETVLNKHIKKDREKLPGSTEVAIKSIQGVVDTKLEKFTNARVWIEKSIGYILQLNENSTIYLRTKNSFEDSRENPLPSSNHLMLSFSDEKDREIFLNLPTIKVLRLKKREQPVDFSTKNGAISCYLVFLSYTQLFEIIKFIQLKTNTINIEENLKSIIKSLKILNEQEHLYNHSEFNAFITTCKKYETSEEKLVQLLQLIEHLYQQTCLTRYDLYSFIDLCKRIDISAIEFLTHINDIRSLHDIFQNECFDVLSHIPSKDWKQYIALLNKPKKMEWSILLLANVLSALQGALNPNRHDYSFVIDKFFKDAIFPHVEIDKISVTSKTLFKDLPELVDINKHYFYYLLEKHSFLEKIDWTLENTSSAAEYFHQSDFLHFLKFLNNSQAFEKIDLTDLHDNTNQLIDFVAYFIPQAKNMSLEINKIINGETTTDGKHYGKFTFMAAFSYMDNNLTWEIIKLLKIIEKIECFPFNFFMYLIAPVDINENKQMEEYIERLRYLKKHSPLNKLDISSLKSIESTLKEHLGVFLGKTTSQPEINTRIKFTQVFLEWWLESIEKQYTLSELIPIILFCPKEEITKKVLDKCTTCVLDDVQTLCSAPISTTILHNRLCNLLASGCFKQLPDIEDSSKMEELLNIFLTSNFCDQYENESFEIIQILLEKSSHISSDTIMKILDNYVPANIILKLKPIEYTTYCLKEKFDEKTLKAWYKFIKQDSNITLFESIDKNLWNDKNITQLLQSLSFLSQTEQSEFVNQYVKTKTGQNTHSFFAISSDVVIEQKKDNNTNTQSTSLNEF